MLVGRVVGNLVSTRKCDKLIGSKILEVRLIEDGRDTDKYVVAIDSVGAGIGEPVLITTGSAARLAMQNPEAPVDAVIVGIID